MSICCHTSMCLRDLDLAIHVEVFVTVRAKHAVLVAEYTRPLPRRVLSDPKRYPVHDLMGPRRTE